MNSNFFTKLEFQFKKSLYGSQIFREVLKNFSFALKFFIYNSTLNTYNFLLKAKLNRKFVLKNGKFWETFHEGDSKWWIYYWWLEVMQSAFYILSAPLNKSFTSFPSSNNDFANDAKCIIYLNC